MGQEASGMAVLPTTAQLEHLLLPTQVRHALDSLTRGEWRGTIEAWPARSGIISELAS